MSNDEYIDALRHGAAQYQSIDQIFRDYLFEVAVPTESIRGFARLAIKIIDGEIQPENEHELKTFLEDILRNADRLSALRAWVFEVYPTIQNSGNNDSDSKSE